MFDAGLEIVRLPMLSDNYSYLIHHGQSGLTAVIDPAQAEPVLRVCQSRGWRLHQIWTTHHHGDHTDGNVPLKEVTGAIVFGAEHDASRVPGLDRPLRAGEVFDFAGTAVRVLDVPGHTVGHIAYVIDMIPAVFCGDALFSLGCGRMFEGTAAQFWESLARLKALPDETLIYCGHEYTQANLAFARHMDPLNAALHARGRTIEALRTEGAPTIPCLLGDEKKTNPFLRADDGAFAAHLGLEGKAPDVVFAHLRMAKDHF